MLPTVSSPTPRQAAASAPLWPRQVGLLLCVLVACLVGIFSRPLGFLAAFWPANALLLGVMLRHPRLGTAPSTWALAFAVYVITDMVTGSHWELAVLLNGANLLGVGVGWLYLRQHASDVLHFRRPRAVLHLFIGCVLASVSCMLVGAAPGSYAFGVPLWQSLVLWFSSEFYNYILILPVFLAAPDSWRALAQQGAQRLTWRTLAPAMLLLASEILSLLVPGPGAMAFIMPGMVWCAMRYGILPTAVLNLLVCTWKSASVVLLNAAFSFSPEHVMETTSYRTGLALLSLAPLAVACAYALRLEALEKLRYAVNHDYLTGTLTRRAVMERGQKLLTRMQSSGEALAVIMLDLDYFKRINDQFGHAQGDIVLQGFARLAQAQVRPEDVLGRMGGEEFALVLPRTNHAQALAIAQRLCAQMRQHAFALPSGQALYVSLSAGIHAVEPPTAGDTLEQLLSHADAALYQAKSAGRNQVVSSTPQSTQPSLPATLPW